MSWHEEHELVAREVNGKRPNSRGWIRRNCPLCELVTAKADRKTSFGYHVVSKRYECYRCGSTGRLKEDPDDYSAFPVDEQAAMAPVLEPPEGFYELTSEVGMTSLHLQGAWDYLLRPTSEGGRGLTRELVAKFGIGACIKGRYGGRVIIPVRSKDLAWLWFVGRVWEKKAEKPYLYPQGGRNGVMFNHAALHVETDVPAGIVEGCFDGIALDPDGVAVLGSPTDANMLAFEESPRPTVFVLDGDVHEKAWSYSMRLRLAGKRSGSVRLPARVDPDELPRGLLREAMVASLDCWETVIVPSLDAFVRMT